MRLAKVRDLGRKIYEVTNDLNRNYTVFNRKLDQLGTGLNT